MDKVSRRTALSLISATGAVAAWPGSGLAASPVRPWLASDEQIAAEKMLLELLEDPEIARIQQRLKADLAASPRAQALPDAAATLDGAIAQWTNSLVMAEINKRPDRPFFLWATEDTPRTWLGHTVGGVGTSGDNPDAIYRIAAIAGGGRYEILGRWHPSGRPTQLLIEVNAGDKAKPTGLMPTASQGRAPDIRAASQINEQQIVTAADGSFRITVGGEAKGSNHMTLPAQGPCMVGVRDILADWNQRAAHLAIRRLDKVEAAAWDIEVVRRRVHEDLESYIRYWAKFPDMWFGGLKPNTKSAPQARPGGWGFVAGVNFSLAPDEAMIVTTWPGGAKYTGFQINDPWMIAPDARTRQVCLNSSQTALNPDGTATFVIAVNDPGVANWLDTAGMRDGLAIIRWQAVPADLTGDALFRDFRVVKLADVAAIKDLPRVTPEERRARVAARAAAYDTRVR